MCDEHILAVIPSKIGRTLNFIGFTPALIVRLPTVCCGTVRMAKSSAVRHDACNIACR
jgi:hypothetical protein